MDKFQKGLLFSSLLFFLFFPAGIVSFVYTFKNLKNENTILSQIDLIARQLGIEYGSAEEKLEQIAKIAVTQGNRE